MKQRYLLLANRVHYATLALCVGLLAVVGCSQLAVVIGRYVFSIGSVKLQDIVLYAFATFVVISLPVALRVDGHVRVDIFRQMQSLKAARNIDILGIIAFLIPVFVVTAYCAFPFVVEAWRILEGSPQNGGLPGYFLVRTTLLVSCFLMILQGIAIILDKDILHNKEPNA